MTRVHQHLSIAPRTAENLRRLEDELEKPMSRLVDDMTDLYKLIVFSKRPLVCRRAKNAVVSVEYQVSQK